MSTEMPERLVFSQTFQGLQRALGPKLDASAIADFNAIGVDFGSPLAPAYGFDVWANCARHAARLLNPSLPEPEQPYRCGRAFIDGYAFAMVGKAMLSTLRFIGPRWS